MISAKSGDVCGACINNSLYNWQSKFVISYRNLFFTKLIKTFFLQLPRERIQRPHSKSKQI